MPDPNTCNVLIVGHPNVGISDYVKNIQALASTRARYVQNFNIITDPDTTRAVHACVIVVDDSRPNYARFIRYGYYQQIYEKNPDVRIVIAILGERRMPEDMTPYNYPRVVRVVYGFNPHVIPSDIHKDPLYVLWDYLSNIVVIRL